MCAKAEKTGKYSVEDPSTDLRLLEELHRGDEAAAAAVFERYFERLIALARSRLSPRLAARIDPDDVVLSAYRSFFVRARAGDFEVAQGRDLWRLLVEITLHKLYRQTGRHLAQRRSPQREMCDEAGAAAAAASREPSPEAVAAVADELAAVRDELSAEACEAFELRLQGYELEEIATALHTTKAVIRRRLDQVKQGMLTRFPDAERAMPTKPKQPRRRPTPRALASLPVESLLDFSDYRLLRQIGSGASGKVYRAIVQPGGELVVVKFMRRSLLHRADYVKRFLREAQLVESLRHEGIIRIRGLGRTPNRGFFLAMEFHERGDLQSQINAGVVPQAERAALGL